MATSLLTAVALLASACGGGSADSASIATVRPDATPAAMTVSVPGLPADRMLPNAATCYGKDQSPAIRWDNVPAGTRSFVIIMEQTSGPISGIYQWIAFNIDGSTRSLDAGVKPGTRIHGGTQTQNAFRIPGYSGPCPVAGTTYSYDIRVYALNTPEIDGSADEPSEPLRIFPTHVIGMGVTTVSASH